MDSEVTTVELAAQTGVPYRTIAFWCAQGRVAAHKDAHGEWRVAGHEAARVVHEQRCRAKRTLEITGVEV